MRRTFSGPETLWPPSFLLGGQKRYGHRVFCSGARKTLRPPTQIARARKTLWPPSLLLWHPKNFMATDSNCPSPKKRYGHRVCCPGARKTLWPPTQIELGPEKRFGHLPFLEPKTLCPPTQTELGLEKRFGHRLKLSWGPKSV